MPMSLKCTLKVKQCHISCLAQALTQCIELWQKWSRPWSLSIVCPLILDKLNSVFVAHVARYISEFVQMITIVIWVSICENTLLLFSLISHLLCWHDGFLHLSVWKFEELVMVSVIFRILVLISCCGDTTIITNSPLSMNGFVFWLTINKHFCCSLLLALFQWWTVTQHVCASCWMNRTVPTSQTLLTLRDSEWSAFPLLAFFLVVLACSSLFSLSATLLRLQDSSDAGGGGGSCWCCVAAAGERSQCQCGQ